MAQKKKLDLRELEMQLPPIESNETKIILGGSSYDGDNDPFNNIFHLINEDSETIWHIIGECDGGGNHGGGNNNPPNNDDDGDGYGYDDGNGDEGDLDHYFDDYQNAGGDDDSHEPPSGGTGTGGFNIDLALTSINNQIHDVYDGLTSTEVTNLVSRDSDFSTYSVFDQQLVNVLTSNSVIAELIRGINGNTEAKVNFDIVNGLPSGQFGNTSFDPNTGQITIQINQSWLSQSIGWNVDNTNPNSYGINYAALGMNQDFVALLTHELIHAQHQSLVVEALQHVPSHDLAQTRDYMLNVMHVNPSLVDTFFTVNPSTGVVTFNTSDVLEHQWMSNPANGAINTVMDAVNQFTADSQNMQQAINHMTSSMDYAAAQASSSSPLGGYTNAQWQQIYNSLQNSLNAIKTAWGSWLNYNGH